MKKYVLNHILTFLNAALFETTSSPSLKTSSLSAEERLMEEQEEVEEEEEDCRSLEKIGCGEDH